MNTQLAFLGKHFNMAPRTRRRRFVALFYTAMAAICLAWYSFNPKQNTDAWILSWCMILGTALAVVFSGVSGDMHIPGDEREMERRGQAYFTAHALFGKLVVVALLADALFRGHNQITLLVPAALRGGMVNWTSALFMAIGLLYLSLPQAILLWTEPDMEQEQPAS
jgi:hypothetical protein